MFRLHCLSVSILCICLRVKCTEQGTPELNHIISDFPRTFFEDLSIEEWLNGDNSVPAEESWLGRKSIPWKEPRVSVEEFGTVVGKNMTSYLGREFYAFHSIPYAKPPTGDLRFKMPQPWEGDWTDDGSDYDGTFLRAKCPQMSPVVLIPVGREDCLHLSIYTPNTILNDTAKYPVMFYIHGGGYVIGDASFYVPTKLMDYDVIVVVVQYRLGSLGFLASGTPEAPGNMGLMDQVMGLRWVQNHISNFGGNPESVTVFGQSAGGDCTSFMMFTPRTNGENNEKGQLLHNLIAESGSAIEAWTLDPDPPKSFLLQADAVGCKDSSLSNEEIVACMKDKDLAVLVYGFSDVSSTDRANGGLGFIGNIPVVQKDLLQNYPDEVALDPDLVVLPEHPLILLQKEEVLDVNVMTGSVRDEGVLVLGMAYGAFLYPGELENNETFLATEFIPLLVNSFGIQDTTGAVSDSLRLAFLRDAQMGNWDSMSGGLVDMLGMMFLKSGLWQLTHLLTYKKPTNNVYFYSFEFESDDSLYDWYFIIAPNIPIDRGIVHGDELFYLFYLPSLMDDRQKTFLNKMTKLWINFATYGNPTPSGVDEVEDVETWQAFHLKDLNFMLMTDNFTMESDFTLRWNYNSMKNASLSKGRPLNNVEGEIMAQELNTDENYEAATSQTIIISLSAFAVVCVLTLLGLIVRLKRN